MMGVLVAVLGAVAGLAGRALSVRFRGYRLALWLHRAQLNGS